ncbi:Glutamate or tyrosine decarboxylase [Ferrithrix thermotolerans DSM 19514]|uniref:Glutamate or tyrosine decarboxylase n=1 Tax=Ferrithrix thermotolerans DSM 19514 TaxID=1121881 RepID=A0A1M4UBH1_9ACTN|nr:pyridoxal-dependent decarboxylase [Ferrithrix thermotolerans]SHE53947.1 Glutamate or tyrosine decarboxylase [Ferrithrix thermotolerans DSM 19514]
MPYDKMHRLDQSLRELADQVVSYAMERIAMQPPPLDGPKPLEEIQAMYPSNITKEGLGGKEVLKRFVDSYAPATLSSDHPRFLAFVPVAPTKASIMFDLIVSASSICGTSWLEAAGAVYLENEALAWLAEMAGMPKGAGGTFVSGGSAGNLSGLHTGRRTQAEKRGERPNRWAILCSKEAHSSIVSAANVMDVDIFVTGGDERGRLTRNDLEQRWVTLSEEERTQVFAVVATAGTTNAGIVDDLRGAADFAKEKGLWFHVDGAYGGAGLLSDEKRDLYHGVEDADSFVVDPHKWLFAPFDCAALIYRDPIKAVKAHTQEAAYLDDINTMEEWNPASFAYHLTRRTRGLPFWFSLAVNGTDAYKEAVQASIDLAKWTAKEIDARDYLELVMEPELSVVMFKRKNWGPLDYDSWSKAALRDQVGFVLPTTHNGEKVLRFCFVNPTTTEADVSAILDSMAWKPNWT